MTYKEVQKLVKEKADIVFPNFKGSISNGGNIFHKRKISEVSFDLIIQTVYNQNGVFPIQISFSKVNLLINYILGILNNSNQIIENMNCTLSLKGFNYSEKEQWFMILDKDDIEKWGDFLENRVKSELYIFEKLNTLEDIEKNINKEIIEENIFENSLDYINLIVAKLLNKTYYNNLYKSILNSCDAVGNTFTKSQTEKLNFFLTSHSLKQLNNIEYLKNQLKK